MKDTRLILATDDGALNLDGLRQGQGFREDQRGEIWMADTKDEILAPLYNAGLIFGPRRQLEDDTLYRQIIPYIVFRRLGSGCRVEFLLHTRGEHIEEARLRGKSAIGLGGHIDLKDAKTRTQDNPYRVLDDIDLLGTISKAASRELSEEVLGLNAMHNAPDIDWCALVRATDSAVSKVHLGVVGVVDVDRRIELEPAESALTLFEWKTQEEILAMNYERREGWTDIVARNLHLLK